MSSQQSNMERIGTFVYNINDANRLSEYGENRITLRGHYENDPTNEVVIKKIPKRRPVPRNLTLDHKMNLQVLIENQHPNVVQLLHFEETNEFLYLVMEFCEGGNLEQLLQKPTEFDEIVFCDILKQISNGLNFFKANEIPSSDIKPQNVLLCHDETRSGQFQVKICDFGFAKLDKSILTKSFDGMPLIVQPKILIEVDFTHPFSMWTLALIKCKVLLPDVPDGIHTLDDLINHIQANANSNLASLNQYDKNDLVDVLLQLLQLSREDRIGNNECIHHDLLYKINSYQHLNRNRKRLNLLLLLLKRLADNETLEEYLRERLDH